MKKIFLIFLIFIIVGCSKQENIVSEKTQINSTKKVLSLGDSLTAGYGVNEDENYPYKLEKKLNDNGYNYKVINAGVSGDTSLNILERANLYIDQDIDIVILVAGGNDGLRGLSNTELKKNMQEIINLYKKNNIKIVLGGMDIPQNFGMNYRNEFKNVYKDLSKENKDIYLLDFFLEGVAGKKDLNISDMIHPNSKGYDIIVNNLFDFMKKQDILSK